MGDAALFSLRHVTQERGGAVVLRDVTLELPRAEVTALIGPSGSGKTSLLRLLNRLDDPTSGEIDFEGRPIASSPVGALRRRVGFVFQSPTMFPGAVADNLAAAASLRRPGERPPPDPVRVLEAVGLGAAFAGRIAAELSGGEQQRVGIARALMTRPDVLLLDEPTSALDPALAGRLMDTIVALARERGVAVVMVTHRLREARQVAAHAVVLDRGEVVDEGPAPRVLAAPASERARAFLAGGE